MRKIAATYLFTSQAKLQKNTILYCKTDGTIVDVVQKNTQLTEEAGLEYYSGILVPGFVSASSRLETACLAPNPGQQERQKAMLAADRKMWASGIAAAADICSSAQTIELKQKSKIKYHTFIVSNNSQISLQKSNTDISVQLHRQFLEARLPASLVSDFRQHRDLALKPSPVALAFFPQNNISALLQSVPQTCRLLLVLSANLPTELFAVIVKHRLPENTFFVLGSEGTGSPASAMWRLLNKHGFQVCFGTDTAQKPIPNSVLETMKNIQQCFPETPLEELLHAASQNGARALGFDQEFGSFAAGKRPGINLLHRLPLKRPVLTAQTMLKRLI